jgi:hypothetical protein
MMKSYRLTAHGSRFGGSRFHRFQAPRGREVRVTALPGTVERLEEFLRSPQCIAAHSEEIAQPHPRSARPLEAALRPFQRTAAYREAFLPSLQGLANTLEASASFVRAPRGSRRCASSSSRAPRSSWGRTPVPSASRHASGADLQLHPCTALPREERLQSRHHRLQGRKNRLQPLRRHLQELEAHLKVVRTCAAAKRILCAVLRQHHSPEPLSKMWPAPAKRLPRAVHGASLTLPHKGRCGRKRRERCAACCCREGRRGRASAPRSATVHGRIGGRPPLDTPTECRWRAPRRSARCTKRAKWRQKGAVG